MLLKCDDVTNEIRYRGYLPMILMVKPQNVINLWAYPYHSIVRASLRSLRSSLFSKLLVFGSPIMGLSKGAVY
jgi:hypothetical protein